MSNIKYDSATLLFSLIISTNMNAQRIQTFDQGWRFYRGDVVSADGMVFDDSKWREVIVPHDFSMEPVGEYHDYREKTPEWSDWQVGPFSRLSVGDWDSGQTLGGTGWYRKTFSLPVLDGSSVDEYLLSTNINLRFDGVYNQSEVWVNGKKAAVNVYGYMPFVVNLNDVLKDKAYRNPKDERQVVIAVKTINQGKNCRWYAGSGIFRHVWLESTPLLHLDEWDTFVDASRLEGKNALVRISTKLSQQGETTGSGKVRVNIIDANGKVVSSSEQSFGTAEQNDRVATTLTLKSPKLWSVVSPYRYKACLCLWKNGKQLDELIIPFGVRTIEFSVEKGFLLNGKELKLKGGCVHHDNGLLGGAAIDRAEVRKVELLKAQGFNAVRCSHNLPSVAFLNACDSLGLLVIDEVFDQWEEAKRPDDYSNFFSKEKKVVKDGKLMGIGKSNYKYDAALMVRRDRNHPSVIMWSIGNEVAQRADVPRGKEIADSITLAIRKEDATRPTTMGVNDFWDRYAQKFTWEKDSPRAFAEIDVCGYNYESGRYESDHKLFPQRIMYASESYPNAIAGNWNLVKKHSYIIGDFVWTAVDYIGEAGLGHALERSDHGAWIQLLAWPWFNSWCGDIDLVGNKKPQSYYRDVVWDNRKIAMAVRPSLPDGEREDAAGWCWTAEENHWNWLDKAYCNGKDKCGYLPVDLRPEKYDNAILKQGVKHDVNAHRSDSLRVNVYTKEKRVRLLLNGHVLGENDVNPQNYTASFRVAYEPGVLKAVAMDGKKTKPVEVSFTTSKAPAAIQFEAVDSVVKASHNDLAYVYINVVDEDGKLCPTAELPIQITTSGVKHIAVAGTGHPYDMKSFRSLTPTTFRGKALLIIQPQEEKGKVEISVSSPLLKKTYQETIEFK